MLTAGLSAESCKQSDGVGEHTGARTGVHALPQVASGCLPKELFPEAGEDCPQQQSFLLCSECFLLPSTSIALSSTAMLSRSLWARQAAPLRRQAAFVARRSVTTDAASAHAENIPQVSQQFFRCAS
jgi:hypothetical protein